MCVCVCERERASVCVCVCESFVLRLHKQQFDEWEGGVQVNHTGHHIYGLINLIIQLCVFLCCMHACVRACVSEARQ